MPAVVREADDRDTLLLGLVENVAREDLSPIEEARGYAVLIDEFGLSLGEVAERVGRSKPAVSNRVRLLELPEDVLAMVGRGELTEGHARAVLAVPGPRRAAQAGPADRPRGPFGARGRARRALGGRANEGAPRRRAVDPGSRGARQGRVRPLTGFEAKVGAAGVHMPLDGEVQLEELAEALERLCLP